MTHIRSTQIAAFAIAAILSTGALACSTGVNGMANVGAVAVVPQSLTLGCNGQPKSQTFVATEAGFNGTFSAQSQNNSVATVSATNSPGQFMVNETGSGSTMIVVTGGASAATDVGVTAC